MQDVVPEGTVPEKVSCYEGVFYNYFSIGVCSILCSVVYNSFALF